MTTDLKIYVGRAAALKAAGLDHLPELAARCHPSDARPEIDAWRRVGGSVVCFSSCTLDWLEPAEAALVMCVAILDDRHCIMPLSEHPEADKWLKLLRVGEFWSTVGEEWVIAP